MLLRRGLLVFPPFVIPLLVLLHDQLAMAHLPRWIDDSSLDSSAMLSAFLGWTRHASEAELADTVPHLFMIEHAPCLAEPTSINGVAMPRRMCQDPACRRCRSGQGGYQFRWADMRWIPLYQDMRRPGSYSFGE